MVICLSSVSLMGVHIDLDFSPLGLNPNLHCSQLYLALLHLLSAFVTLSNLS